MSTTHRFTLNVDSDRELITFDEHVDWDEARGGIARFDRGSFAYGDPISVETARILLDANYMAADHTQNRSPPHGEFVEQAEQMLVEYPDARIEFIGYIVSALRDDARVTITGMYASGDEEMVAKLALLYDNADDHSVADGELFVWWD